MRNPTLKWANRGEIHFKYMSEEIIENSDSLNGDEVVDVVIDEEDDTEALKKKFEEVSETNKKLYARAKKAEGFEFKDGKWVKPQKVETKTELKKEPEATKSKDLGYAEKAFLNANGVKGSEEYDLVKDFMENTGKDLESIVESKFFQSELKELREAKRTEDATPKGTKRSVQSSKDSVDYWLAKGELPENTPENQELRRKVVNARYERESKSSHFAGNPVGKVAKQSQQK